MVGDSGVRGKGVSRRGSELWALWISELGVES
jgi:hypothetical protein